MSMVFFLDTDGTTRVGLDNTASVSVSMPSEASSSSTMSGIAVSDEVIEGNVTISVTGRVTYAKMESQSGNLDPLAFEKAIQTTRRNRRRFTVYYKDTGQPLMQNYKNCVLVGCDFTIDVYSDTITVSLTFEQIFVSQAAEVSYLSPRYKESDKPTVKPTTDGGQSVGTTLKEEKKDSILKSIFNPEGSTNVTETLITGFSGQ